jgi:sulfur relay (sulfurtransferase) DsrC/TusE family protein
MSNDIVDNVQIDVDGFLCEGGQWNDKVAFELAAAAGIRRLSTQHWQVINALRAAYVAGEPEQYPRVPEVCAALDMDENCIADLFGDSLIAWQVSGLPKPNVELTAHMPGSVLA